jgi:hypothetical protein
MSCASLIEEPGARIQDPGGPGINGKRVFCALSPCLRVAASPIRRYAHTPFRGCDRNAHGLDQRLGYSS